MPAERHIEETLFFPAFFFFFLFGPETPARTRHSSHGIENQPRFLTSPALRIPSSKDVLFSQPAHSEHPLQHRRCHRASLAALRPRGAARITPLSAFPLALRGSFKMGSRKQEGSADLLIPQRERRSNSHPIPSLPQVGDPKSSCEQVVFTVPGRRAAFPAFHVKLAHARGLFWCKAAKRG